MTTSWLLWTLLFSSAGLGFFIYGTKQRSAVPMVCGLGLMLYSYFVSDIYLLIVIGVVLTAIPRFIKL
jgi:hypothetical protein